MRTKWLALSGAIAAVMAASAALSFPLLLRIASRLDTRSLNAVLSMQYVTTIQHASWLCILSAFLYEDFAAKTVLLGLVMLPAGYLCLGFIDVGVTEDDVVGVGTVVALTGQGACIAYTSEHYLVAVLLLIDLFDSGRSRVLGFLACTYNITLLLYYATFTLLGLELAHFYVI